MIDTNQSGRKRVKRTRRATKSARGLLCILLLLVILKPLAASDVAKSASPRKDFKIAPRSAAPLLISLPAGAKTATEEGEDFLLVHCALGGSDPADPSASMTIYVGQWPERLSNLVGSHAFFEEPAQFGRERVPWFSWIGREAEQDKLHFTVYLYNFYRNQPNKGRPYIINIHIVGSGEKVKLLKDAAATIRIN